jgi:hypothetical protein
MRLSWRDALATLLVAIALGVYAAWTLGAELPGFGTVGAVAIIVLGLGVVASASAVVPGFADLLRGSRGYLALSSAFGLLALAAGVYALVAGEAAALTILVLATVAMWAMATARHAVLNRPQERFGHR